MSVYYLHFATIVYSTQHVVLKKVIDDGAKYLHVNLVRFSLAALCNSVHLLYDMYFDDNERSEHKQLKHRTNLNLGQYLIDSRYYILNCFLLSVCTYISFALQAYGLLFTSASKSAYMLYFNVKLVVVLELLLFCKCASLRTWISVIIASIGVLIICLGDNILPNEKDTFNKGDMLTLLSSCFSAYFIILTGKMSYFKKPTSMTNSMYMSFTSLFFLSTVAYFSMNQFFNDFISQKKSIVCGICYLGLSTYVGQYLQTCGQEEVEASKAALIFALDPVYNILWSRIFLGEIVSLYCATGMAFIFTATFVV